MMKYSKKDILSVLDAKGSDIINIMSKTKQYRKNNLITYSKNVFIPLTEICRNDCGY